MEVTWKSMVYHLCSLGIYPNGVLINRTQGTVFIMEEFESFELGDI